MVKGYMILREKQAGFLMHVDPNRKDPRESRKRKEIANEEADVAVLCALFLAFAPKIPDYFRHESVRGPTAGNIFRDDYSQSFAATFHQTTPVP
jgi:hypothetical protein